MGYLFLTFSIIFELFGTTMLKMSEAFTVLWPSIGVAVGYGISFYFLAICLRTLPLSLAYAIWSGIGTALTAIIGVVLFDEILSVVKIIGLLIIISGVVVLNVTPKNKQTAASL